MKFVSHVFSNAKASKVFDLFHICVFCSANAIAVFSEANAFNVSHDIASIVVVFQLTNVVDVLPVSILKVANAVTDFKVVSVCFVGRVIVIVATLGFISGKNFLRIKILIECIRTNF